MARERRLYMVARKDQLDSRMRLYLRIMDNHCQSWLQIFARITTEVIDYVLQDPTDGVCLSDSNARHRASFAMMPDASNSDPQKHDSD